jgi:hypothetical protein
MPACAPAPEPEPEAAPEPAFDQAAEEAAIREMLEQDTETYNAHDFKAQMALYVEEIENWDGSYEGRAEQERMSG